MRHSIRQTSHDLTCQEREAEIELDDGEVLLLVDEVIHYQQDKISSDEQVWFKRSYMA